MKIAVVIDSGTTISSHFGRAPYYLVFTVEDGTIVGKEQRDKAGHQQYVQIEPEHHDHDHEHGHGLGAHSADKHTQMLDSVRDCQVVIVRGMGRGAYVAIQQANIRPILTEFKDAEAAVQAYIDGTLVDHPERLH